MLFLKLITINEYKGVYGPWTTRIPRRRKVTIEQIIVYMWVRSETLDHDWNVWYAPLLREGGLINHPLTTWWLSLSLFLSLPQTSWVSKFTKQLYVVGS